MIPKVEKAIQELGELKTKIENERLSAEEIVAEIKSYQELFDKCSSESELYSLRHALISVTNKAQDVGDISPITAKYIHSSTEGLFSEAYRSLGDSVSILGILTRIYNLRNDPEEVQIQKLFEPAPDAKTLAQTIQFLLSTLGIVYSDAMKEHLKNAFVVTFLGFVMKNDAENFEDSKQLLRSMYLIDCFSEDRYHEFEYRLGKADRTLIAEPEFATGSDLTSRFS